MTDPGNGRTGPLLIVNADDYGLTAAVSAGILRAHREGIVTSTSVLAVAPGLTRAGGWLADEGDLGVGVHLALVGEDRPLLSAAEIPSLVDRDGLFAGSWRAFVPRAVAGRIDRDDVRRELAAQIEAVAGLGVRISHLDGHQHLHLLPMVRDVVIDLAGRYRILALRVPRSHRRRPTSAAVNRLARRLAREAAAAGVRFPEYASGVDEAGRLDTPRFVQALDGFVARGVGSAELGTHPGESDDPDRHRYRWGYHWGDELGLLTARSSREVVDGRGFVLGTYADLPGVTAAGL